MTATLHKPITTAAAPEIAQKSSQAQASTGGWIFSKGEDVCVFWLVPVLIGLLVMAVMGVGEARWGWEWAGVLPYPLGFFLFVLIDLSHQYSTFFLTVGFRDEYERRRIFYWVAPPLICGLLIALNAWDALYFVRFYAYYSAYHFIRQEYGWMMMAARKGGSPGDWLDGAAIYAVTLGPLLYMSSVSDVPSWFVLGDLWPLPMWAGNGAALLAGVICALYLLKLAYGWGQGAPILTGKLFIWLKSALIWGGALMLFQGSIWGVSVMVAHHGLPYLYLAARYIGNRKQQQQQQPQPQQNPSTPHAHPPKKTLTRWIAAFLTSIWLLAAAHFLLESNLWDWLQPLNLPWLDAAITAILYPALASVGVFHFVVDSFFWKIKYNPHLRVLSKHSPAS